MGLPGVYADRGEGRVMTKKRRYAENTSVEVSKSVAEMRQLLKRAGAVWFSISVPLLMAAWLMKP